MDLSARQSLDNHHRGATRRTEPEIARGLIYRVWGMDWRWDRAEHRDAEWQKLSPLAVGQEAEAADADEAFRKQVQEEAV